MGKGKAILLGSSLLLAGSTLANSNNLFETTDLGSTQEVQERMLELNQVDESDISLSPSELNCAYGDPKDFQKRSRKWQRQDKKNKRKAKRKNK